MRKNAALFIAVAVIWAGGSAPATSAEPQTHCKFASEVNLSPGLPPPSGAAIQLRSSTLVVQASIAEQDVPKLKAMGIREIFLPGTPTSAAVAAIRGAVQV